MVTGHNRTSEINFQLTNKSPPARLALEPAAAEENSKEKRGRRSRWYFYCSVTFGPSLCCSCSSFFSFLTNVRSAAGVRLCRIIVIILCYSMGPKVRFLCCLQGGVATFDSRDGWFLRVCLLSKGRKTPFVISRLSVITGLKSFIRSRAR